MDCDYFRVGRVPIAVIDYNKTKEILSKTINQGEKGYVCVSNMRTVTFANKDEKYYELMEHSLLNLPDGMPLVWCGHWWGRKDAQRVCGPHLFSKMLSDKQYGFRHFFLGDTEDTLSMLCTKAIQDDNAIVSGSYSPPFKPLEKYNFESIAKTINDSGANVVWTSLRAPKQDFLGQMLQPFLNDGIVVIGVGAAFRSYLGEYKAPDGLLQKMGLAGLGMLRNTTIRKEIIWYTKHSIALVKYFCTIFFRRLQGKKCYEL